jgi:hypothetical protein
VCGKDNESEDNGRRSDNETGSDSGSDSDDGETYDETLDEMVGRLRSGLPIASRELEALRRAVDPHRVANELPGTRDPNSEADKACSTILDGLVDAVWEQCFVFIPPRQAVESEKRWWETHGDSLRKDLVRRKRGDVAWVILSSLVAEVVAESLRELHDEAYKLKGAAQQLGGDILLDCVQRVCSTGLRAHDLHQQIEADTRSTARTHSMTVTWFTTPGESAPRPRRPIRHAWDVNLRPLDYAQQISVGEGGASGGRAAGPGEKRLSTMDAAPLAIQLAGRAGVSCTKFSANGQLVSRV